MKMSRWLMALALCAQGVMAHAADLKVLTAGAFKPVLMTLKPEFEARTGHRLLIDNDTAGGLQRRIAAGEAFDVVISSAASLRDLPAQRLAPGRPVMPVAKVGIGVGVRTGEPLPDISSVTAFQQMLLKARRIALIDPAAGGSSGIYLTRLFEQWGLGPQLREKSVLVPGGLTADKLVDGSADVALQQVSEILVVPGVTLVGPLPAPIQNYTQYSAAASATSQQAGAVDDLMSALQSPALKAILQAKGME